MYVYVCMCLFDQLSLKHANTRSSTKFGIEMLHEKLKKNSSCAFQFYISQCDISQVCERMFQKYSILHD